MEYKCSLLNCSNVFAVKQQRIDRCQSGLLFCSNLCKNEALRLAYREDHSAYKKLIPAHYKKRKQCLGCSDTVSQNRDKYCSIKCGIKFKNEKMIESWINGEIDGGSKSGLYAWARRYMLSQADYKCSRCSWSETNPTSKTIPLEIDHIDGNYLNNKIDNLRVLCPNCHSLTPTYKSLNRDTKYKSRYAHFKEKNWW